MMVQNGEIATAASHPIIQAAALFRFEPSLKITDNEEFELDFSDLNSNVYFKILKTLNKIYTN